MINNILCRITLATLYGINISPKFLIAILSSLLLQAMVRTKNAPFKTALFRSVLL